MSSIGRSRRRTLIMPAGVVHRKIVATAETDAGAEPLTNTRMEAMVPLKLASNHPAPHQLTIEYLKVVQERPNMFYTDHELRALENQVHGFDAALAACGAASGSTSFNLAFSSFVAARTGRSCSQGWAMTLLRQHGHTPRAEADFWKLFGAFLTELRAD